MNIYHLIATIVLYMHADELNGHGVQLGYNIRANEGLPAGILLNCAQNCMHHENKHFA